MKGWAPGLALKKRLKVIRKWPIVIPKLNNYSCSSYPTRAAYSGQLDGFRNWPNEKQAVNTAVFETISNTVANFLNLHIDRARKTQYMTINNFS